MNAPRPGRPPARTRPPTASFVLVELPRLAARGEPVDADAIERAFFAGLKLRNGTRKTVTARRLDDLNAELIGALRRTASTPRDVIDVAASSGVSTAEWAAALQEAGFRPRVVASDLVMTAFFVSPRRRVRVLVDATDDPLAFEAGGRHLNARVAKTDLLNGRWALVLGARWLYRWWSRREGLRERLRADSAGPDAPLVTRTRLTGWRIAAHPDIECIDDDIAADNPPHLRRRFDVVRAANILNLIYFAPAALEPMVRNLALRLRGPGAWLVVCRTVPDGTNQGTIFRLTDRGSFSAVARVGRGSEIEDLVLACRITV